MTDMSEKEQEIKKETLKLAGIIKDLSEDEIADLLTIATEERYRRGSAIVREDAKSRDLYIIREGRVSVKLKLPSESGREEVLYQMRDSQVFGELSLIDGSPRSATVFADDDVVAYRLNYDQLLELLENKPHIGYIMMRNIAVIIANRVRDTNMLWRNSLIW